MSIHGVYFAYLDLGTEEWEHSRAKKLVQLQLGEIRDSGLASAAKEFHIVFTCHTQSVLAKAKDSVHEILPHTEFPQFKIHLITGNIYEYPGILCAWNVAQLIPVSKRNDSVVLYFHSKGMTNGKAHAMKSPENKILTKTVLEPWRDIVARFQSDPALNKAGFAAAEHGWIWYNFWWTRASYLANCPKPMYTERRHYYEDWLGREDNGKLEYGKEAGGFTSSADCLSLYKSGVSEKLGVHLPPLEAQALLEAQAGL